MAELHQVDINWMEDITFEASADAHTITLDAAIESGGNDKGFRPKKLLLSALGGCTAVDVVLILRKMNVDMESFRIEVVGQLTDTHPKVYSSILLKYYFTGKNLDKSKLNRAIELSQEKYCGVTAMLKNSIDISYQIIVQESVQE